MNTAIENLNNVIEQRETMIYKIMLVTKTNGSKDYYRKEALLEKLSYAALKKKYNNIFN